MASAKVTVSPAVATVVKSNDYFGQGRSNILWHNISTFDLSLWQMNATTISGTAYMGNVDPTVWYRLDVKADFNGDGKTDILWGPIDQATYQGTGGIAPLGAGPLVIWMMNGTSATAVSVTNGHDSDYVYLGSSDFNRDGKSDMIWRSKSTSRLVIWLMNGGAIQSSVSLGTITSDWRLVGTGDFNSDGNADMYWFNTTTLTSVIWLMNGTAITQSGVLGVTGSQYYPVGVGDFSGSQRSSILWRNQSTGDLVMWTLNGTSLSGSTLVANVAPSGNWGIVDLADYDGDGKTDLLFEQFPNGTAGTDPTPVVIWDMNGTQVRDTRFITTADQNWISVD